MRLIYKSSLGFGIEESINLSEVEIEFEDPGHTMRMNVNDFLVHIRNRIMELEVKVQELEQRDEKAST